MDLTIDPESYMVDMMYYTRQWTNELDPDFKVVLIILGSINNYNRRLLDEKGFDTECDGYIQLLCG